MLTHSSPIWLPFPKHLKIVVVVCTPGGHFRRVRLLVRWHWWHWAIMLNIILTHPGLLPVRVVLEVMHVNAPECDKWEHWPKMEKKSKGSDNSILDKSYEVSEGCHITLYFWLLPVVFLLFSLPHAQVHTHAHTLCHPSDCPIAFSYAMFKSSFSLIQCTVILVQKL